MSQHLNPASALSDHRESIAWPINNGPLVAYCNKLGPNWVKAGCLCPPKAATIFQHTHAPGDCAWPRPPTTKDMKTLVTPLRVGYLCIPVFQLDSLGFIFPLSAPPPPTHIDIPHRKPVGFCQAVGLAVPIFPPSGSEPCVPPPL